jgi:hypothetical protein
MVVAVAVVVVVVVIVVMAEQSSTDPCNFTFNRKSVNLLVYSEYIRVF